MGIVVDKRSLPIGVFDSGMGGLTVLKAMEQLLPNENMLYLGDTARLPYGTKSRETVSKYSEQAASKLIERQVKMIVIACNTATAAALDELCLLWPDLPIFGVVRPGAQAACAATHNGKIAVLATESTIRNQAYQKAITELKPDAEVVATPSPLLVPIAEEGWLDGPIVEAVIKQYLDPVFSGVDGPRPDTLVLGCTHFPALYNVFKRVVGDAVTIVDSAATTALAVQEALTRLGLTNYENGKLPTTYLTTDDAERFRRVGTIFMGYQLDKNQVELIDL